MQLLYSFRNKTYTYIKPANGALEFTFNKESRQNTPGRPFRIDYETFSFVDLCSTHGQTITHLPVMLKSPGFSSLHYPSNRSCDAYINVPGAKDIIVG